jgi:TIR domain-containing protein
VAYLPDFDEDVFISYAHNDDDTYGLEPRGWVAQLHVDLGQRVKVHLGAAEGADLRLWRDCEIRNNEDFAKKISGRLAKTGTFLLVISPSSVHREWCVRELEEFASDAERTFGLRVDNEKWRIFKVEKLPVDRKSWPALLQHGTMSYKFHGPDPRHEKVHEFRPMLGGEYGIRYYEEMDTLAKDIAAVLSKMTQRVQDQPVHKAPNLAVYLAESTSDLDKEANEIRRDLKERGYLVLPSADLPNRANDFKEAVRGYLARSVLSVHLIGRQYGIIPEGEMEQSNAWLQNDLAMQRSDDPSFVRLVWMPGDVKPSDARQEGFIKYLLEDPAAQQGADILTTKLEDLKTNLQERLRQIRRQRERPRQTPIPPEGSPSALSERRSDGPLRVYMICDQLDRQSASLLGLKKYLFSLGYEPILPSENEDEKEALQEHADNLAICDACVIYYGQGSDKWFGTKLRDFRKTLSRRENPVLAKAVYVAPPNTESKSELETHEAIVLRGSETFAPEALTPFLNRLVAKTLDKTQAGKA